MDSNPAKYGSTDLLDGFLFDEPRLGTVLRHARLGTVLRHGFVLR